MTPDAVTPEALDAALALQLTVAWAGEGLCDPPRLGWWQTDLIDELGGGDLLARLLPTTHRWAALEAVRQAAAQEDRQARQALARPEEVRTLFFWGFEIDEKLDDRLTWHKRGGHKRGGEDPRQALPFAIELAGSFSRGPLEDALRIPEHQGAQHKVVPGGRELLADPSEDLELRCRRLAAALLPLAETYPMPFFRVEG